jgi:hypothetical protein
MIERHRGALRAGLVFLAVSNPLVVAVWGLLAPRNFYDDFPGGGHAWVSALGPYNEHLLRDFAAADLGFAVLLLGAAVFMERRLVQMALISWTAAGVPHLAYHLTTTGHYSTTDNVGSLAGLIVSALLPLGLLAFTRVDRRERAG